MFSFGWPKTLASAALDRRDGGGGDASSSSSSSSSSPPPGRVLALASSAGCVALVTSDAVEIWSAGARRRVLGGVVARDGDDRYVSAAWLGEEGGGRATLAVLTRASVVRI